MFKYITNPLLIAFALFMLSACDDKEVTPPNEEELITTLEVRLTPAGGGQDAVFLFRDLDGDGGQVPVIAVDTSASGSMYSVRMTLFNESVAATEEISVEVGEEAEDHQLFVLLKGGLTGVTFAYADWDAYNDTERLDFTLQTGAAGSGELEVM